MVDFDLDIMPSDEVNDELIIASGEKLLEEAGENLTKKGDAINRICEMLFKLEDPTKRTVFVKYFSKKYKLTAKIFTDKIAAMQKSSEKVDLNFGKVKVPEGVDLEFAMNQGYFELMGCYWFLTKDNNHFQASNFIIKPLYHIYSKTDNKRLIEVINMDHQKKVLDVPSHKVVSLEQFQAYLYNEGNFLFQGSKAHLFKILSNCMRNIPRADEIKSLGWQEEGFYAFANGIFNAKWQPVDSFGMADHKNVKYFLPAFSEIYQDVRKDDDIYQSDRYFVFTQAGCSFSTWTSLMLDVYQDNGMFAVSFAIAAVFRDLIFEKFKIFPHLYLFGEKQSGKSQLLWSLSNLFFHNYPPFNLNSGTQVGFFRRIAFVVNALACFEEYSNDIDPKRNQHLKGAYDGMGHEKGRMSNDNRTDTTKVSSAICMAGQYLPTTDDNALLTRCIPLFFERRLYSSSQMENYEKLKKFELDGISSLICEILPFREKINKAFAIEFSSIMEKMKDELSASGEPYDDRLVRNYCCILAPIKIILDSTNPLALNFTFDDLYQHSKNRIASQSRMISSSEAVASFWSMVEFMFETNQIKAGEDFVISTYQGKLSIKNKEGREDSRVFNEPKKLLFIRFTKIHPLYLEEFRKQSGRTGVDKVTLLHYFRTHKAFVGQVDSWRFDNQVTSAFVFEYGPKGLDINIERTIVEETMPF